MKLVKYGVAEEKSDYRAHVGVLTKQVYFFPTKNAIEIIEEIEAGKRHAIKRYAGQYGMNDMATGAGYAVPITDIENLQTIDIPQDIFEAYYQVSQNTSVKGQIAVDIVADMFRAGLIPVAVDPNIIDDKDLQLEGTDIVIQSRIKIQVKYDERAGPKKHHRRATGNVFLQTEECNPFKAY